MHRMIRAAAWLFFAGTMYLILEEALWPWLHLPALGNIGFTVVFVLFALFHCIALEGLRRCATLRRTHTRPAAHRALLHGHTGIRRMIQLCLNRTEFPALSTSVR